MSTTKAVTHTPGPWTLDTEYPDEINAGRQSIAECRGGRWRGDDPPTYEVPDEVLANARLIAAAPELLEALENLENDDNSIPGHAWKLVQDAIRKAKEAK